MNDMLQKLQDWGCDMAGALERCLGDGAFLLECIREISEEPAFHILEELLEKKDVQSAFRMALSLKGITANTGLTPLYVPLVRIVDLLQVGELRGTLELYRRLESARAELLTLLRAG